MISPSAGENPSVSVIIPCFDAERWLADAINSCIAQGPGVEVIVVDDGSGDRSGEIIEELARAHPTVVRHRSTQRLGAGAARNTGIQVSRGRYLLFLDADDLLEVGAIDALRHLLDQGHCDMAVGEWINFFDDGSHSEQRLCSRAAPLEDPVAKFLAAPSVVSAVMIRATACLFDASLTVNEVTEFFLGLIATGYRIGFVDRVVTRIRQSHNDERVSIKHDHFEPIGLLELFTRNKTRFREAGLLSRDCQSVFDRHIISCAYQARRRGDLRFAQFANCLDPKALRRYSWFKPTGVSGFVSTFGYRFGTSLFFHLNRILGRV